MADEQVAGEMWTRFATYAKCRKCGHVEDGVCGVFWGHRCENCGAVDATDIVRRRGRQR